MFRNLLTAGLVACALAATTHAVAGDEFLHPDRAFALELARGAAAAGQPAIDVRLTAAPGYYLYRDKMRFRLQTGGEARSLDVSLPPGETKSDPNFGETVVFHGTVGIRLVTPASEGTVELRYQGCSEEGLCYNPITKTVRLPDLALVEEGVQPVAATPGASSVATGGAKPAGEGGADLADIGALFASGSLGLVLASFFGFGLLLALTPCVFPMIPILSGIIVGAGGTTGRWKAFALSVAYVLGMATTYAAAGVAAGLSGQMLSALLQNAWVLGGFALVFVALAASMFGAYELQLPASVQTRFLSMSGKFEGGRHAAVFVMGALSALIVGPCVAPPLAGALLYIGQTGNALLGGAALFAMALGMGVPLLVVGTSAGALMPRAGAWMNTVKSVFGVALLATALWIVAPVLPAWAVMALAAALLVGVGVFLRAIDPLPADAGAVPRAGKAIGVGALVAGVAMLVGLLAGGRDPLKPLEALAQPAGSQPAAKRAAEFVRVSSVQELEARLTSARGQPVVLDFYADWCVSCKEMERFTFADERVRSKLERAVLLQADVTANDARHVALLKRFGLFGPPGIVFFDAAGAEAREARVIGYQPAERFLASLARVPGLE